MYPVMIAASHSSRTSGFPAIASTGNSNRHILLGILIPPSRRMTTPFNMIFSIPC